MYEFVQQLVKKKKMGFQPGTNMACNRRSARGSLYEFVCTNLYYPICIKNVRIVRIGTIQFV